jgi:DNA modification methylase
MKEINCPHCRKRIKVEPLFRHKLIIGDCTKKENWERLMGKDRFDLMETDPPYNLAYSKDRTRKVKTKDGWKLKNERVYSEVGETDKDGKPIRMMPKKEFGAKQNRIYEGMELAGGVPEFDEWLSLANEYQNPKGANVMIFESWKNTVTLWQAIEKYWKIMNMIVWFLPNRHQGFSAKRRFYSKYDIAQVAGKGDINLADEVELNQYLDLMKAKSQKLLDTYEVILYGSKGDSAWGKAKGSRFWMIGDHITWGASSEASTGQNVVFGTKPIQVLVPYIKILSPRNGIVMEPFGGSGSTLIASDIMHRKCRTIEISPTYSEVIINRWQKFTGKEPELIE